MTERQRIESVLSGAMPDKLPWATRLEIWYNARRRTGTMPGQFREMSLNQVHEYLGVGRQAYSVLTPFRMSGVDCEVSFEGRKISGFSEPVLSFPKVANLVPTKSPGKTEILFKTPVGSATCIFRTTTKILDSCATPYLEKHILSNDDDYDPVFWILDHGSVEPAFDDFNRIEEELGDNGMTMGMIERVPFQRALLDFMGEERCFFQLYDNPKPFAALIARLAEIHRESVEIACRSPALVVECGDNLDGNMTNPDLFKAYSLQIMQQTAEKLHSVGKYFASHVDGDLSALVEILPETGLDVAESFSPFPLSQLTFEKAYATWGAQPVMWGILPFPLFEAQVSDKSFQSEMRAIMERVEVENPVILGIGDQAVWPSLWQRIGKITEMVDGLANLTPAMDTK